MNKQTLKLSVKIGSLLKSKHLKLVTAESCTGGLIAAAITDVAGSSSYFEHGFISYSNESKQKMLGVKDATIKKYGAVSAEVTCEMAIGALRRSKAQVSIAVSGIAGPSGGSRKKPVGTVCFCFASKFSQPLNKEMKFKGSRGQVRLCATRFDLEQLVFYLM